MALRLLPVQAHGRAAGSGAGHALWSLQPRKPGWHLGLPCRVAQQVRVPRTPETGSDRPACHLGSQERAALCEGAAAPGGRGRPWEAAPGPGSALRVNDPTFRSLRLPRSTRVPAPAPECPGRISGGDLAERLPEASACLGALLLDSLDVGAASVRPTGPRRDTRVRA